MRKSTYIVTAIIPILMLSILGLTPVNAFIYPDCHTDDKYEFFGPHSDYLIFNMYAGTDAMWTELQAGHIDITDWPLDTTWRAIFATDPNVKVVSAGGEAGFYTIDFNYNNNSRMGNPVGSPPNRPNPVYDAVNDIPPISNNIYFRLGCGNLFDRAAFNTFLGAAGIPILTVFPSYMTGWIWPGATGYTYSRVLAEAKFALGKIKQSTTVLTDGHWTRYWDRNNNNVIDPGEKEACVLKFTWRQDAYRKQAGTMLHGELLAMNFSAPIGVGWCGERTGGANYQQVMLDKNYHITTLGWINVGPDPDHPYDLYHIDSYWDDPTSSAPNTAALNDSVLNSLAEQIKFAASAAVAKPLVWSWQQRFEQICAQIPLFSNNAFKAGRKWYSGGNAEALVDPDDGENVYRRKPDGSKREWLDKVNQMGRGDNNFWGEINMYPNCSIYGDPDVLEYGNMVLRYGWKEQAYPQHINPFYSEWYWDAELLGMTYDGLGYRNPNDLSVWMPNLVKTWEAGIWRDPSTGTDKSKVTITLRPDVRWQDGTPMTVSDVVFSLVEAGDLLLANGYQPPWWWPTGELVSSLSIVDAYTVEILYRVQSYLAESWTLGGFYIVPKHIWKPIIESANPNPPTAFCPDPNVIGSGPYRYHSFHPLHDLVMVANKPGSTVTTDRPGAVPITSPGYFAYYPVQVNVHADNYKVKFDPGTLVNVTVTLWSEWANQCNGGTIDVDKTIVITWPNSSQTIYGPYNIDLTRLPDGTRVPDIEVLTFTLPLCRTRIDVNVHIKSPDEIEPGKPNPWKCHWVNVTLYMWGTIKEDICGSTMYDVFGPPYSNTYPWNVIKSQLPVPDCKVDMINDIRKVAKAFGSYPGHPRWDTVADINDDYNIDMLNDIRLIAKKFGWPY